MKRWQTSKEQKFHHSVYVILLDEAVAKHPSILRLNRKRNPLKPCVIFINVIGIFEEISLSCQASPRYRGIESNTDRHP